MIALEKKENFNCNAKFLIVVLDGVGFCDPKYNINFSIQEKSGFMPYAPFFYGNAVNATYTPNLYELYTSPLFRTLKAHGTAVGLPSDEDMGNSEVGHNALGSGRIFSQGAKLVNAAIENKKLFQNECWQWCVRRKELSEGKNTLHLCGLLSDGNVHSHIDHLFALIKGAKESLVKTVRLHLLLDGRDVSPLSALDYVEKLEFFLAQINDSRFDCRVASGGGRTFVTMDRYDNDWSIVERGYNAHVLGDARSFDSLKIAIETYRHEGNYFDQDLPAFVISENQTPLGAVQDDDSFIFFNFRGDRAIQISKALTEVSFNYFDRKRFPKIRFAGMMQYDGDLKIPEHFLVTPPSIDNTMTELLSSQNIKQFACSETQKFGHVTYFWNGNRSGKFNPDCENYIEIPSDNMPFSERPWMKAAEIADETIKQMKKNSFVIGRINFANGDMVGHTGNFAASIVAMGAVDLAIGRLMQAAKETNTVLIVTADHGNADEMYELDKKTKKVVLDSQAKPKPKTSHTLSPVPFSIYNESVLPYRVQLKDDLPSAGLANIASTVLELAGYTAPSIYEPSLVHLFPIQTKNTKEEIQSILKKALQKITLPTLSYACEISKAASQVGFCWPTLHEVFHDVELEIAELKKEIDSNEINIEKVADEIGDVVFALANLVNFFKNTYNTNLNFDIIAQEATNKFITRFQEMEKILANQGIMLTHEIAKTFTLDHWNNLWNEAKKRKYR